MALPQKPGQGLRPGQRSLAQNGSDSQRSEAERHATDELLDQCQRLEEDLDELKAKYELFFLGVERLEPARRREEMKRNISRLKSSFTRNAGARFRIETLYARYLSYERMWKRAARQKEEGTYQRDVYKARRRGGEKKPPNVKSEEKKPSTSHEDLDLSDWNAPATSPAPKAEPQKPVAQRSTSPAVAPQPAPATRPPSPAPAQVASPNVSGLTGAQMRSLYDAYIQAKKRCNEDVSRLSYDAVSRSVSKQIPEIMTRYKAKAVDFKVVIKDGKALLKAVPKS